MAKHSKDAISVWRIEFHDARVERDIEALSPGLLASFLRIGDLLKNDGPHRVGMPYVRPLGDKLWEMRLRDESGIARAIYVAASERRLVVLHVFRKTTQKTPDEALRIARRKLKEVR